MAYLTDKEKRLLFSALTREKKVCIEVDKECCRENYEDTLESVVKNLERKFYYDRFEKEIRAKAINEFAERLEERIVGMQMVELQGEDVCPCAETGEECPYINQDIGCQYCAREHTIKEINEIAEEMRGGEKWETQLKIMKRKDVKRGKKPTKKCKKWFLMYWLKGLVFQGK